MKRILIVGVIMALIVIAYMGWRQPVPTDWALRQHEELVELDKAFLPTIAVRPSSMTSGTYTLETWFHGKAAEAAEVELEFSDGQLVKLTGLPIQGIVQHGHVVFWERFDYDEGPSAAHVGLVDGNTMWGRVYVKPGQGWHEGEPPAYGVWRLVPKKTD
jgi:hypothetical protein